MGWNDEGLKDVADQTNGHRLIRGLDLSFEGELWPVKSPPVGSLNSDTVLGHLIRDSSGLVVGLVTEPGEKWHICLFFYCIHPSTPFFSMGEISRA